MCQTLAARPRASYPAPERSTAVGDLADKLRDIVAGTRLDEATVVLAQLEPMANELVKQADEITIEALRRQADGVGEHSGQSH